MAIQCSLSRKFIGHLRRRLQTMGSSFIVIHSILHLCSSLQQNLFHRHCTLVWILNQLILCIGYSCITTLRRFLVQGNCILYRIISPGCSYLTVRSWYHSIRSRARLMAREWAVLARVSNSSLSSNCTRRGTRCTIQLEMDLTMPTIHAVINIMARWIPCFRFKVAVHGHYLADL